GGVAAAFACVFGGLAGLGRGPSGSQQMRLRFFQPFARVIAWLDPPIPHYGMMGDILGELRNPSDAEKAAAASIARELALRDPVGVSGMSSASLERRAFEELDDRRVDRAMEKQMKKAPRSRKANR